ncbi:MAG: MBOAT family O-acyltransferase [Anaerovoracaceae bacterium]|nr:MBOAT family protein [Bacillota bacterium]MDY2669949.1 MBOAT family O-acyltransferase [Anaerovoracaceae bacterium]
MLFNSYIFIFLFMPLVILGFFALNHFGRYKAAEVYLIGMSLWFYGYYNPKYLVIICTSIVLNYLLSRILSRLPESRTALRKAVLIIGLAGDVGAIFYYKYYDFFIKNVNAAFDTSFNLRHIMLPLGISFFTFQQISYLVDSYRGETRDYGFIEYALFVVFFPQLIAGPIVLHSEVIPQFRDRSKRKLNMENMARGIYIFSVGLFKKVLIADTFGRAVTWGYGTVDTLSSMEAILVSFCYTFQLYFDFSGYCDMANGLGRMLNIELPWNFDSPYKALSIQDFWGRWHLTLTRFLRQYIYFPLGGSYCSKPRTYFNIMAVFLVSGIWHGADWTFIAWGLIHGAFNCFDRAFKKQRDKMNKAFQWLSTFLLVNLLWILFRADSFSQAALMIKKMVLMNDFTVRGELTGCFNLSELNFLDAHVGIFELLSSNIWGFNMWCFLAAALIIVLNFRNLSEIEFRPTAGRAAVSAAFLFWSITSLTGVSVFLYFGF